MKLPSDLAREFQQAQKRITRKIQSAWFQDKRQEIERLAQYDSARGAQRLDRLLTTAQQKVPRYRALRGRAKIELGDFPLTR